LMATFHPAYLLRNPSEKRLVWEDIKRVMAHLELPVRSLR
jgi:uracil-DNA glycosylase